ncbi:hypothetical protein [Rhizobium sp. 42MFCr.1]|jgi:hypothetical protein|uniref:hypothetical protein n=1 Tax=Rhizobium sp. 42MFCr.1 TaxID=1048680 RepID=UPI000362FA0E|nr:hypothetical protein [Rhizobium sp. 42MFCr.1]
MLFFFARTVRALIRVSIVVLAACWTSLQVSGSAALAQDPFGRFPLVITCQYKDTFHAFYLSRVTEDGTATFVASDRIGGTITLHGRAKAIGDSEGESCVGKTLEELRASGQARDIR